MEHPWRKVVVALGIGLSLVITWSCAQPAPSATKRVISAEEMKARKIDALPAEFPPPPGDDERPPIIISDGSIDIYLEAVQGKGAGRGKWIDAGAKKTWVHLPGGSPKSLSGLTVHLLRAVGSPNCENPDYPFKADWFKVVTKVGGTDVPIMVDSTGGYLSINSTEEATADSEFWLVVGNAGSKLESITFSDGSTCSFKPGRMRRGTITAFQR